MLVKAKAAGGEGAAGARDARLPVTIISGFLGSGKTTLLKHLLENTEDVKMALIVNDMAELNIDAALVRRKGAELSRMEGEDGKMVELDNGCICCSLKPNMVKEISRFAKERKFDYIVIESSGICEPMPIAEVFYEEQDGTETKDMTAQDAINVLGDMAKLDTMVTVVDVTRFAEYMNSLKTLIEHYGKRVIQDSQEGHRSIAELLVDQVEFANVILINKTDIAKVEEVAEVKAIVKALNPNAIQIETSFSKVESKSVIATNSFDLEKLRLGAGWAEAMRRNEKSEDDNHQVHGQQKQPQHQHEHGHGHGHGHGHAHERDQKHKHRDHYGITSFIYHRRRPFHPERLKKMLDKKEGIKGSLRSKGFCWIASRHSISVEWNMAGKVCGLESGGKWFAEDAEFKEELKSEPDLLEKILADFEEPWGDRRIELVVIGIDMDQKAIETSLDACLVTDEEMKCGPKAWKALKDEFPEFEEVEDDELPVLSQP